jgi:environmental stress-induced protein Ves
MQLLPAAAHRRMPWKNGGGMTTEIAVFPPGAGLDDFAWRISMARVESDGPFSLFPGIDRTLMLLDGEGLHLSVGGRGVHHLARSYEIAAFPADVAASARLDAGPITDLNVMTRRGACQAEVKLVEVSGELRLAPAEGVAVLVVEGEGLTLESDGEAVALGRRDAVIVAAGETAVVRALRPCNAVIIVIGVADPH